MADAQEYVAPLRGALVPVPAVPQDGICALCHSSASPGYSVCRQCSDAAFFTPPEILPITMSVHGGLIHHSLRYYKDSSDAEVRERLTMRLGALLAIFMNNHSGCVGEWDVATCVPSAQRVAMEPIVQKLARFENRYERLLVGKPVAGERKVDPAQFDVVGSVKGRRVLLLEDTFASGSKLISAAAALRSKGATVVGPVALGRHVNAGWPPSEAMLAWLGQREWKDDRCCRCAGERREEQALF